MSNKSTVDVVVVLKVVVVEVLNKVGDGMLRKWWTVDAVVGEVGAMVGGRFGTMRVEVEMLVLVGACGGGVGCDCNC